jgi:hypothetical protein
MARRVFFSFHYEVDIWRATVVRNSWVGRDREDAGFWDGSLWEESKKKGDAAIQRMIDEGMRNTSVTAVLIGAETWDRKWVRYEIARSHAEGKGLLGIYVNQIKNSQGLEATFGPDPFDYVFDAALPGSGKLSSIYPTYWWFLDKGYENIGSWVEQAARKAGR